MRYGSNQKANSRARILSSASKRVRVEGAEAVRVGDVMKTAGLTVGGFYKHFASKEQLLSEAIALALDSVAERIATRTAGMPREEALKQVIDFYLSEEHLRRPDLGCALAALGTEMARMPNAMKREVSKALDAYAARLSYLMPGSTEAARRAAFRVLFPSMAGCLMTARVHSDRRVQQQMLAGGRAFFLAAFCSEDSSAIEGMLQ